MGGEILQIEDGKGREVRCRGVRMGDSGCGRGSIDRGEGVRVWFEMCDAGRWLLREDRCTAGTD